MDNGAEAMHDLAVTVALVFVAGYAVAWLQLGLWRLAWLWDED